MKLLKPLIKPPRSAAALRHISAVAVPSPEPSSAFSQTLTLLKSNDPNTWPTNPNLPTLLSSLTPPAVLNLTRHLPSYQNALHLFNHLNANPGASDSLPLVFQGVLEHAMRENPGSPDKLYELFVLSKDQSLRLSVNSAILLIKCFGRANMVKEMVEVFDSTDGESRNTHVCNAVLAGLLRWGKVDYALKVLDEMLEPETTNPPNGNTVDVVFSSVLKRNWSGRSLGDEEIVKLVSRFGEHGVSPNGFWMTQIVSRFCRNGCCGKAWDVVHGVMDSGCDVEVASCNALLTGLGAERDFVRMNLLMKEMKEKGIEPNIVTYGIMIKHLCKVRRVDQALEVFQKLKDGELGVEPDVVLYNTLIDGLCKVGRQEEGLKLMERMRLESRCEPNTVTYNCLIDGFCKAGEIERGRELFELMNKQGVKLNVITFNTLLDGMCKHGRVGSALDFFEEMEKGMKGNAITYTVLITAFCNANNIDKAMRLFDKMRENGCSPDAVVYYSLISGLTQAGRMDDATSIVTLMKAAGFCLDIISYNILISGFCKKNKLKEASEMLKDMEKAGVKPDRVTYNTLISFFCDKGDFAQAHRVLSQMIGDGLKPTVVTFGALIQSYCLNNNLDAAMKIFKDMSSSSKVPPNTVIYNMLIDALCKNDNVEHAVALMSDMKDKKVIPNSTTYNALFKGLQQRNWVEKAIEYMDQMTEQACNPDYITMEILTEWLCTVGEKDKLQKFVQGYEVSASQNAKASFF